MRINIDDFKSKMRFLADNGFKTVRFDDLSDSSILAFDEKKILIAFDDGWLSNYTGVFDFMKGLGLKYNVFLTVGKIGNDPDYLSWDMVRKMHESGICGFGTHTYTHSSMSDLEQVDWSREVLLADTVFKRELCYVPEDFCYPYGFYSESSNYRLEAETGYERIYTSEQLFSYSENSKIVFGRNAINAGMPLKLFNQMSRGFYNIKHRLDSLFYRPLLDFYHLIRRASHNR